MADLNLKRIRRAWMTSRRKRPSITRRRRINWRRRRKCTGTPRDAAEADTVANRHAVDAVDLYRHHHDEVADHKAEVLAEDAARAAKREAKGGQT